MVTIVIPFQADSPERTRNLQALLRTIENLKIGCIVIEQVPQWELDPKPTSVNARNIRHMYFSHDGLFQKSKMINKAVKECHTKYIWLLDADVYLDFNTILRKIENQDIIRPFRHVDHLPKERTQSYLEGEAKREGEEFPRCDFFGKFSIIFKREIFNSVGGFDESFEGWGWEDLDFVHNRLGKLNLTVDIIDTVGIHLYHPEAPRSHERKNFYIYKKNSGGTKKISFCMHVKNRCEQLKQTLAQNLKDNRDHSDLIEFVLVDFASSDTPLEWILSNFRKEVEQKYLKLYKIFDFPFWHASIAKNTSHYLSEGDILVNLDCDNFTGFRGGKHLLDIFDKEDVVAAHQFCQKEWFSGNYGRISIRREVFDELGGYNESFLNMGYQDTDLLKRIELKYPDGLALEPDPKYNKAIANEKEKSIENVPADLKQKGFFWMNDRNKESSKQNLKKNELISNEGLYGIREGIRAYDFKSNSFKPVNA